MEKENVLEIEFQPVFDKWAWRITKQNEEILGRNVFKDEELNVESLRSPDFLFLTNKLFLRGDVKSQDNNISFCNQEEKALIEEKVKAINEKYGIVKRWRAKNEGWYYYIHSNYSLIVFAIDHRFADDNNRYETGNYFSTEKEAKEYMEYMKKKSLEWHEKRENNE